jgi:hypothetical protein
MVTGTLIALLSHTRVCVTAPALVPSAFHTAVLTTRPWFLVWWCFCFIGCCEFA